MIFWLVLSSFCKLIHFLYISDSDFSVADCLDLDGWNVQNLFTQLPQQVIDLIHQVAIPSKPSGRDTYIWKGDPSGYKWLQPPIQGGLDPVWRVCIYLRKSNIFCGSLPTNERSSASVEDMLHTLRDCPHSQEIWFRMSNIMSLPRCLA
ncbi:hypothetical protein E2542_SST30006 [Spatholobus suberectus]|nr:hypothetical protein E2542_SST30006 [Spatholobus suberectus]